MPARQCCSLLCNSKIAASIVMRMGTVMNREDGGLGASFSVFSVQFSVFSFQCSVFSVQFSVFSVQCSVFSFQCSVFETLGSCRVVHDPSAAEGRFGPAFMPGAMCGQLTLPFHSASRVHFLAGSFTTLPRPKAGSARHSCRVRCADDQPFHFTQRVLFFSCRVVHDPSAAEGRFGPAFMPGTLSFATAQLNTGAQWAPLVPYRASTPRWHTPLPTTCSKTHNQESPRCASQWSGWY